MSLPRKDFDGQISTITAMEFRSAPGDAIDRAAHGMTIHITKNGTHVATLGPPEDTIIHADGSFTGKKPLTMGRQLGNGGYGD